jgi:hypothetical protein
MSAAPKRYLDEGPSRARDLLSRAKSSPPLPIELKAASAASLAKLGAAKTGTAVLVKWLLGGLLLTGIAVVGAFSLGAEDEVPAPRAREVSPPALLEEQTSPAEPELATPEPAAIPGDEGTLADTEEVQAPAEERGRSTESSRPERSVPERSAPERSATEAPTDEVDTLAEEIALLEGARLALASDPAAALSRAREHSRLFPHGQFAAPAELLEIDALLRLGRRGEAEERARSMAERRPSSLYRERLVTLVGEEALSN